MMYILHGDNIPASRNRLSELTNGYESFSLFQGDKTNFLEIKNSLYSTGLFESKKCIVIEHIMKLPKADLEKTIQELEKDNTLIVLWQGSEMTKLQIGKFKNAVVESFMLPKLFFTFLDNFVPRNSKSELTHLSNMTNIDEMQIFYALIKRVRALFMIKTGGNFEELVRMSPWQKDKLKTQSARFTIEQLEEVYKKLFELEIKLKSGGLMLPLKNHLDIMLVSTLN